MRLDTITKHHLTADYFEWTGPVDAPVYGSPRQIKVSLLNDSATSMALACSEPLMRAGRIQNIRDKGGVELFPARADNPTTYQITSVVAAVDAFGYNTGYRVSVRTISL